MCMDDVESMADRLGSIFKRIATLEAAADGNRHSRDSKNALAERFAAIENRLAHLKKALGVASIKPQKEGHTGAPCAHHGEPIATTSRLAQLL